MLEHCRTIDCTWYDTCPCRLAYTEPANMSGDNVVTFKRPTWDRYTAKNASGYRRSEEYFFMHRLIRYLSPQIAEMILKCPDEDSLWEFHRQDITVVFVDLRGF